jgi:hypothetical protein
MNFELNIKTEREKKLRPVGRKVVQLTHRNIRRPRLIHDGELVESSEFVRFRDLFLHLNEALLYLHPPAGETRETTVKERIHN